MKLKRIIASISAAAMLMTSVITASAYTSVQGEYYNNPIPDAYIANGEYPIGNSGAKWVLEHVSVASQNKCKVATNNRATGKNSLYLNARGSGNDTTPGVKMTLHLGQKTSDGIYTIQFDLGRQKVEGVTTTDSRDYVTLNNYEWQGGARLNNTTIWTKGNNFENNNEPEATVIFNTYTATLSTDSEDPQLSFAMFGEGRAFVDNIIIKDSTGKIIFDEDFEGGLGEQYGPEVPRHTYVQGKYYELPVGVHSYYPSGTYPISDNVNEKWVATLTNDGSNMNKFRIWEHHASTGGRSLYLAGRYGGDGSQGSAKLVIHFGQKTGTGEYTIQFDMARESADSRDYVTLNMDGWDGKAQLNSTTIWTKSDKLTNSKGTQSWYRYTGKISTTLNPELTFGVYNGATMFIDNIIIKDSTGTIVFSEGFEGGIPAWAEPEEPVDPLDPSVPKHTYLHGKFYESPLAADTYFAPGEYAISNTEKAKWVLTQTIGDGSGSNKDKRCKILINNAATGGKCLYLAGRSGGSDAEASVEMSILFGELTGTGEYDIQFDIARERWVPEGGHDDTVDWRDYITLNKYGWDNSDIGRFESSKEWVRGEEITPSVGTYKWYTYTGTFSTKSNEPQLNFAVFGYGNMFIDNIIIRDSTGTIVFSEGFEGGLPEGYVEPIEIRNVKYTFVQGNCYELPFPKINEYYSAGTLPISDNPNEKWVLEQTSDGSSQDKCKIAINNVATGGRSLYLTGRNGGDDSQGSAHMTLHFGELTGDGTYYIQFDMAREVANERDYITLNMYEWAGNAQLNKGKLLKKGAEIPPSEGTLTWNRYTGTFTTTENPELDFAVFGYGNMFIDNIIITDSTGTIVFEEGFEGHSATGAISDAEFIIVDQDGDGYEVIGSTARLKSDVLMMSVVRIENEDIPTAVSANVYTALYKGNCLVSFDSQTISAATGGEMSSGSIIQIPELDDGVYTLKVIVWDNYMNPLKDVMLIGE